MRTFARWIAGLAALAACTVVAVAQTPRGRMENLPADAEQVFALANQARAEAGAEPLRWDAALARAAVVHCRLMVSMGTIGHRYQGEADLAERAAAAGARFALIEENVAEAPSAAEIHSAWMQSPGHRKNLMNPNVDRVGIAVIASHGELFVVADYARGSEQLSTAEVERRVGQLIAVSGVHAAGSQVARAACSTDRGMPQGASDAGATVVMRWENADLSQLPGALTAKLASGHYRRAEVGNCPAHGGQSGFTMYRVAVLLY